MKWTKKMGICLLLVMILNNGSCLWNQMISVKASEEPIPTGVMEMTKEEQNQVAMYLFNSISLK